MGRFEQVRANIRRAYEAGRATVRAARADDGNGELTPAVASGPSTPDVVHHSTISRDDADVPRALRIGGAWAWRMVVIGVIFWALFKLLAMLTLVVVPLVIATLLAALLAPAVGWLRSARVHRSLAAAIAVVGGLAAVVGTLTLVIDTVANNVQGVVDKATQGLEKIQVWLKSGPMHLTDKQLDNTIQGIRQYVTDNTESLTTGALSTVASALEILGGTLLVLFALFFLLRDGRQIWVFFVNLLPRPAREPVDDAGLAAWRSLSSYVRATVLVAFIDAVGIGIALAVLGVPLALPLAALVFLTAFIPIIGATISGAVAVLVALVAKSPFTALLVLIAVIAVQQLEGHVLQPLIMGRAVAIHPLAVIVGIAAGFVLAGIIGALIAVPMIAMLNTAIRHLVDRKDAAAEEAEDPALLAQEPTS